MPKLEQGVFVGMTWLSQNSRGERRCDGDVEGSWLALCPVPHQYISRMGTVKPWSKAKTQEGITQPFNNNIIVIKIFILNQILNSALGYCDTSRVL